MKKVIAIVLIFIISLIFTTEIAWGNTFDTFGYNSRATAMGGAFTAIGDELTACYYNPAALAEAEYIRAEAGYFMATTSLDFNVEDGSDELEVDDTKGFNLGLAIPLGEAFGRWVVGFGFHKPQELAVRPRFHTASKPFYLDYSNRTMELIVLPAIGFSPELLPELSIGLGISVFLNTEGSVISPSIPVNDYKLALTESDLTMPTTMAIHAGLLYKLLENLRLGLAFRDELPIDIETKTILGSLEMNVVSVTLYSPRQIALGVTYVPLEKLTVAADLTWIDWSQYTPPFPDITGDLGESKPIETNFEDTFNPGLGIEYHLYDFLDLRAGYLFEPSPVPDETLQGTSNILDTHTHIFSGGFGLFLGELCDIPVLRVLRLDGHFQFVYLTERKVKKNPNLMLESDADALNENPGYPGFTIGGNIYNWGTTLSLVF
ncbi:MAG: outer membrane protein transport protein [Deltaproteobacteria bacterium]|nr:MAG: outer membrane protein transport protein [Deltaproteobacteria bacterium]